MTQHHEPEALTFHRGESKALPHTLSATRHLTMILVDFNPAEGKATFELHNPEAQPDGMVSGLIEENLDSVTSSNRLRELLHLAEKPVPVDTSTKAVERLECSLHQKLLVGDRVWAVAEINDGGVVLTAGRDHESKRLINRIEDLEYSPESIAAAERLGTLDRDL